MLETEIPPSLTVRYDTSSWSRQQMDNLKIAADAGYASIRILPDLPNTIEVTSADFCAFFGVIAGISSVVPAKKTQPNIKQSVLQPVSAAETSKNRRALLKLFGNIIDVEIVRQRFAGIIRPQRQMQA